MTSHGISDKVAIVGMGCTRFGERWEASADDLLIEAVTEAFGSARVGKDDIDAYWLGTLGSGQSGLTLSRPLGIDYRPVTRVENYCATGSEAFRNACYAVASGAYDRVMAVGVEKLKDSGFSGLLRGDPPADGTASELSLTAPAAFSLLDPATALATPRPSSGPRSPPRRSRPLPRWPDGSGSSTAPESRTDRLPPSSSGPRTPTTTPTSLSS